MKKTILFLAFLFSILCFNQDLELKKDLLKTDNKFRIFINKIDSVNKTSNDFNDIDRKAFDYCFNERDEVDKLYNKRDNFNGTFSRLIITDKDRRDLLITELYKDYPSLKKKKLKTLSDENLLKFKNEVIDAFNAEILLREKKFIIWINELQLNELEKKVTNLLNKYNYDLLKYKNLSDIEKTKLLKELEGKDKLDNPINKENNTPPVPKLIQK